MLHHVAPVASSVAYTNDDEFVLCFGFGQGFFPPRVPVYRVAGVLEQVGRLLAGEVVNETN